jgi:ribosome maturation protein SDO1
MATLEKSVIAHFDSHGERFEIIVDPKLALDFRLGKKTDFSNILVADEIFKDSKKGEIHKPELLKKVFGTDDIFEVAKKIIKDGEVPVTTEQKHQMMEEKRKKIIAILARECIDPRTGTPHPPQRIERAMEEARVRIDPFKSAEAQLDEIISPLRPILPLKFEKARLAVRVPADLSQKCYGALKEYNIQQEEWASDGSLIAIVEIPAGTQAEFFDRMNRLTAGRVQIKDTKKTK